MLILSFFSWWYGRGWQQVARGFGPRLRWVNDAFSARQLLRTLFEPWRRIITYPGASLEERVRAWGDNAVSRVIGFVVRFFVLVGALVTVLLVIVLTAAELVVWPLLPAAIPGCLVAGILL